MDNKWIFILHKPLLHGPDVVIVHKEALQMAKPEAGVIVLKDNAHELHWRKEPPKWKGNIDMAYKKFYPHLVDEVREDPTVVHIL